MKLNTAQRVVKNSTVQALATVARALATLLVYAALARTDGSGQLLGTFVLLITAVTIGFSLTSFGVPALLTTSIARLVGRDAEIRLLIGRAISAISFCSGVAGFVAVTFAVLYGGGSWGILTAMAAISVALETYAAVLLSPFRAAQRMEVSAIAEILREGTFLVLALVAIWCGSGLGLIMLAHVVSRCASLAYSTARYCRKFGRPRWGQRSEAMSLLRDSSSFALHGLLGIGAARIELLAVGAVGGRAWVALYEVGSSLSSRLTLMARTLNQAMLPLLSASSADGTNRSAVYTATGIRVLLEFGCVLSMCLFVFAADLIGVVFGPGFEEGVLVLQILALPASLRLVNNSMVVHLQATNRQQRVVKCLALSLIALVCGVLLIPWLGLVGAACARIAADIAYSISLVRTLGSDRNVVLGRLPMGICLVAGSTFMAVHAGLVSTMSWPVEAVICSMSAFLVIAMIDPQVRALLRKLRKHTIS